MHILPNYDFTTLYTTLPHNLIKERLLNLIEHAYKKFYKNEGMLYLAACNDKIAVFTSADHRGYYTIIDYGGIGHDVISI